MLCSGIAELLSLGMAYPFLLILDDPDRLWAEPSVQVIAKYTKIANAHQLLLAVALLFAITAILATAVRLLNLWLNDRIAAALGTDLSIDIYRRSLYQSYTVHQRKHSSELIAASTTHVTRSVEAITALLQALTASVVALSLFTGLLFINWRAALAATSLIGSVYFLLGYFTRQTLRRNSREIANQTRFQVKSIQESLGSIRDVILSSIQERLVQSYYQTDLRKRRLHAANQFITGSPRYVFEALGVVVIALLGVQFVLLNEPSVELIPTLGSLALAAQRLLPALQQVYANLSCLKSYNSDLQAVLAILSQDIYIPDFEVKPLSSFCYLSFNRASYRYDPEQRDVLKYINLQINRGDRLGLIGGSGSGKSTMGDLILGLIQPTMGQLIIDGLDLHDPKHPERLRSWQAIVAQVPQHIFLLDRSFAENIAFGVPTDQIDYERVANSAAMVHISTFIEGYPDGYHTLLGEGGIRISGGQRQRLGIARALYKRPQLIVLDEPTSALDPDTENAITSSFNSFSQDIAIVLITHRISTLKLCNRVVRLDNGAIASVSISSLYDDIETDAVSRSDFI